MDNYYCVHLLLVSCINFRGTPVASTLPLFPPYRHTAAIFRLQSLFLGGLPRFLGAEALGAGFLGEALFLGGLPRYLMAVVTRAVAAAWT